LKIAEEFQSNFTLVACDQHSAVNDKCLSGHEATAGNEAEYSVGDIGGLADLLQRQ
jgi:hypothetical protein